MSNIVNQFKYVGPKSNSTIVRSFIQTANGKEVFFIQDSFGEVVSDYFDTRWEAICANSTPNFNV